MRPHDTVYSPTGRLGGLYVSLMGNTNMHIGFGRACQASGGRRLLTVALCASLAVASAPSMNLLAAAPNPDTSSDITGSLAPPEAPYEVRTYITAAGTEGFELAGRLREFGGLITKPISWRVFKVFADETSTMDEVYRDDQAVAQFRAAPGDYRIEISYGLAVFSRTLTLEPGHHLSVVFNLNVGGLRVLSRLSAMTTHVSFHTSHRIYAMSGEYRGRMLAENAVPGELLRLPAGRYRIESELSPGNALAGTDIDIKPGMLSAVEIDHAAGIAHLTFESPGPEGVDWQVIDGDGRIAGTAAGESVDMILNPGRYQVMVFKGSEVRKTALTIKAGQSLDIDLGR